MKGTRKKIALWAALISMAAFGLSGCGNSESSDGQSTARTLRIGTTQVYTTSLTSIAVAKGYIEEELPENVSYEFSKTASGPDGRDAVVANQIDITDVATMTYQMSEENDLPISIICGTGATPIYLYSASDEIQSLEDFGENSRISITNKATTLHAAFLGLCKDKLGDALKYDANLVSIPAADALAALTTKSDFDGAIFSFPNKIKADQLENLTLLEDMTPVIEKYGDAGLMISRKDYIEQNSDIIDAFINALKKAKDFVESNPDEAAEILSETYGVEAEYIKEAFEVMPPAYTVSGYDELSALLYDAGILTKEPTKYADLDKYSGIPQ